MFEYLWAFFSNDAVSSIIALAAFILSVVLAISAVRRNILRIKVEESTIIFSPKMMVFYFFTSCFQTNHPYHSRYFPQNYLVMNIQQENPMSFSTLRLIVPEFR